MTNARYFELIDPSRNHHKFWEIVYAGTTVNVRYGRIGTAGRTQVKTFKTTNETIKHVSKLIGEKTGKGYKERSHAALPGLPIHQPIVVAPAAAGTPKPSGVTSLTRRVNRGLQRFDD